PDAPVQPYLNYASAVARRVEHGFALIDRIAGWLFDINMRACLDRSNRLQRVPVIGRCDDDNLRLLLLQQIAIILVSLGLIPAEIIYLVRRDFERMAIHITQRDSLDAAALHRFFEDVLAPPARTNKRRPVFLVLLRAEQS